MEYNLLNPNVYAQLLSEATILGKPYVAALKEQLQRQERTGNAVDNEDKTSA
jgi:hypothetical protein